MADANDRFLAAAAALGVAVEFNRYPEGTRTAVDAAQAVGCDVGQIVKSLVFMADEAPVMALTAGHHRVDTALLSAAFEGAEVRQASADEARAATGFAIGGTPPFGHGDPIRTVIDRALLDKPIVWAAAGTPDTCFPISPDELVRASRARAIELA